MLAVRDTPPTQGSLALEATGGIERRHLAAGAWVDLARGWWGAGQADELFEALHGSVPWRAERRPMYDRVVGVPRLLAWYGEGEALPHPDLGAARDELSARYGPDAGGPLVTAGLCLYRDGADSVAWHGDTLGRSTRRDTVVAIISLGASRRLLLRPTPGSAHAGGPSLRLEVGHGDLLVMGGSCQRTWQHAVPKSARPVGPRISVQLRPRGVR